jgi:selenocysteine lyase/cysteine desulfurase
MRLTQLLLEELKHLPVTLIGGYDVTNRTSIVFLKDENGLGEWLKQHNIVVTHRDGNLRISMHFYNTEKDIEVLVDCLRKWQ